jgi:hypothetical protein
VSGRAGASRNQGRSGRAVVGWALAAALLLAGDRAPAEVHVYSSETNAIPNHSLPLYMAHSDTKTVELYIAQRPGTPSSSGTPCVDDTDGDETCGFELKMLAEDDFRFTSFTEATLGSNDEIKSKKFLAGVEVMSGEFDELRVNGTNFGDPSVPMHFGSLDVLSGSNQARAKVVSGLHVDASGDVATLPQIVIIQVPEASRLLMLLAGLALLCPLHHLRSRRIAARGCS